MAQIYISQLDAFDLYHLHHLSPHSRSASNGGALPALGDALAGCTGAAISNVLTYPLALIVTRLQVQRLQRHKYTDDSIPRQESLAARSSEESTSSIPSAFLKTYNESDSLSAFYTGVTVDTIKTMLDAFLFFYAYNFLRETRLKQRKHRKHLPVLDELGVGFLAGAFSKLLTTPLANVVTRKQAASATATSAPKEQEGTSIAKIAAQIYEDKGLKGFWAGYTASLILTLNPSITFFLFETLKRIVRSKKQHGDTSKNRDIGAKLTFLLAALSKATASSITYPFSLAKARLQVSSSSSTKNQVSQTNTEKEDSKAGAENAPLGSEKQLDNHNDASNTVFGTVDRILRTEGLGALYEGLGGEVMKGFFSHGITMTLKDGVHSGIIRIYFLLSMVLHMIQRRRFRNK